MCVLHGAPFFFTATKRKDKVKAPQARTTSLREVRRITENIDTIIYGKGPLEPLGAATDKVPELKQSTSTFWAILMPIGCLAAG